VVCLSVFLKPGEWRSWSTGGFRAVKKIVSDSFFQHMFVILRARVMQHNEVINLKLLV
jgi:hypothetical protein